MSVVSSSFTSWGMLESRTVEPHTACPSSTFTPHWARSDPSFWKDPDQGLDKGGLAHAVGPDDGDLVAVAHDEADFLQHLEVAVTLADALDVEDILARALFFLEEKPGILPGRWG